jgi:hypothetical protein
MTFSVCGMHSRVTRQVEWVGVFRSRLAEQPLDNGALHLWWSPKSRGFPQQTQMIDYALFLLLSPILCWTRKNLKNYIVHFLTQTHQTVNISESSSAFWVSLISSYQLFWVRTKLLPSIGLAQLQSFKPAHWVAICWQRECQYINRWGKNYTFF